MFMIFIWIDFVFICLLKVFYWFICFFID